jgi:hypothetical protein
MLYYISEFLFALTSNYTSFYSCCQEVCRRDQSQAQSGAVWNEGLMHSMDQRKHAQAVQRRARGVQRIASILAAAETVFAEVGYDEANTNRIAAQSGISPGSLYQFFSNKEEIAQALAARYTEELEGVYGSVFSVEAASLPFSIWLMLCPKSCKPALNSAFGSVPHTSLQRNADSALR